MTTDDLTYDNLASKLVEAVPTLRAAYEKEMAWWGMDKAGPVNIFDAIVTPRLMKLLSENPTSTELKAIFNFLELMTKHPTKPRQSSRCCRGVPPWPAQRFRDP